MTAYCTTANVRTIANLSTTDISDSDLRDILAVARKFVMQDVSAEIVDERVKTIDAYRENLIDSDNTIFYVQNSLNWYFFDRNGDGELTTTDVKVYSYDQDDDSRTELTVSAIDESGFVTLASAPSNTTTNKLTISYRYSRISIDDVRLVQAAAFLTAALAFTKLRADEMDNVSFGALKGIQKRKTFEWYDLRYRGLVTDMAKIPRRSRHAV